MTDEAPIRFCGYEQGPIRPPSESGSLLVRVSRNCPWNRCAFCPVYKGARFSRRTVAEVLSDLDALRAAHGDRPRTAFLQDADPLLMAPDDLVQVVAGLRARFPRVERVTAYARSHTLARRSLEDLRRLRAAGLDRLHVGLESGCDAVLALVTKGTTRAEQIEAGQRVKAAGFTLSEYVMPGLGGAALSSAHAEDTASALVAIQPDFVRLRTTAVVPGTPLAALVTEGRLVPLGEVALVAEIRALLAGLGGLTTRLESDHVLNALMELRGDLPADRERLRSVCDTFLGLPERTRTGFLIARRLGWMGRLADVAVALALPEVQSLLAEVDAGRTDRDVLLARLRARTL